MFLLEWTASDLLFIVVAAVAMIGTVLWLVPSAQVPRKRAYTVAEITAYDRQIPRYFIAAAVALLIGGVHILIKSMPGFWQWLWEAGYGGHLFRDLSNSHIIIVGGGTVLLTGITWYVLPRFANRPLFSTALASGSFWFTLIGVFGFYAAWLILGLVEGNMVRHGMDYMAAKEVVGAWHRVPTRITASIMGVGYWTYVLNVFLTVFVARHVQEKPSGHLLKFVFVSAAALFVGTVQGVIQVLPANADWIHYAGKFGQYVDPISHAHINLVTGMMVALSAFLIFFSHRMGGKGVSKRTANRLFWTLVPGSLLFYLAFLFLGLILGGAANGYGGIQAPALVPFVGRARGLILAVAGVLMLAGFWVYFFTLWRSLDLRSIGRQFREATPSAFWLVASLALVIGTLQGILQVLPPTTRLLTTAEEVPNIHAQLNMIGGVMLALIGLVYLLLPDLVGKAAEPRLQRISLWSISGGIGTYYLATLVSGLLHFMWMTRGLGYVEAATHLGSIAPTILVLTAVPLLVGFAAFATAVFRATTAYRAEMAASFRQAPARFAGPMPERLRRVSPSYILALEFAGGLFGWPGIGWLLAGQALPAVGLMMAGPAIAWALLPMLFSPFTNTVFSQWGWHTLLVWLPASALLSSGLLALYLRRLAYGPREALPVEGQAPFSFSQPTLILIGPDNGTPPARDQSSNHRSMRSPGPQKPQSRRKPRATAVGMALVLLALFSVPLFPLLSGIPADSSPQSIMSALPERAAGAYLQVSDGQQSGLLKLFSWSFPLDEIPEESPVVSPRQLQSLVVRQKGLDDPQRYQLFHMDDGDIVHLTSAETVFQRELQLAPAESLPPGDYMLNIPTGGMFAGREYYYFRLDPAVTTLPPLVTVNSGDAAEMQTAPAPAAAATPSNPANGGWLEIFPLSAALISALFAVIMLRRMRQKARPHEAAWTVAFIMFAVAAGSQVIGDVVGWTPALARLYYVCGATLVVAWLGLGTWLILVHRPWLRNAGLWLTLLLSGYAFGLINLAPVDMARLPLEGWQALAKPLPLTVLTIALNSIGTLILVGGALWSAWTFWRKGIMRSRMVGLVLLAGGALVVAAGGSLTRLGHEQYLYIAMSVGVGLMFWGYLKTILPQRQRQAASPAQLSKETTPMRIA